MEQAADRRGDVGGPDARAAIALTDVFYRQLPARSPIPGTALPRLAIRALGTGADPRAELRARLLNRYSADGALLCAKGTHALQVALAALQRGNRANAPVLLPAYTCYEVATAAIGANARVALYDVDPETLEPDWDSLRASGRSGAAAVVIAPLYGMPLNWAIARSIAEELDSVLIEDAAQAHGTMWSNQPVGSIGDLSILSFGRGKGWTGGGGGALLWRGLRGNAVMHGSEFLPSSGAAREATSIAAAGAQWLLGRPSVYGLPAALPFLALGETVYHHPTEPAGMTRSAAALALLSERASDDEVLRRRSNAGAYAAGLAAASKQVTALIGARADGNAGMIRFPLRRKGGWRGLKRTKAPSLGAAPPYPTSLNALSALRGIVVNADTAFPGAELLVEELVTLPTHSQVTAVERKQLIEIVGR